MAGKFSLVVAVGAKESRLGKDGDGAALWVSVLAEVEMPRGARRRTTGKPGDS